MQWIENWLLGRVSKRLDKSRPGIKDVDYYAQTHLNTPSINFNVFKADGGYVVQYTKNDLRAERQFSRLHIVAEDKDLGAELGKIITFEALRN